jgi:excisionase family DNA binding protein
MKDAMITIPTEIMTIQEVADLLQVHRSTVHLMRNRGQLVAYKFGRRVYFRRSEVIEAITSSQVEIDQEETTQAA